jgi:hypothetical protein
MTMKRFLILFIVIVYSVEGYAGSNKWTKPDFNPNDFETDREECIQSIDQNLVSEAFGKALEGCLAEKGYKYQQVKYKEMTTVEKILLVVVATPVLVAYLVLMGLGGSGRF